MEPAFKSMENKQFQLIGINRFVKWEDDFDKILKESENEFQKKFHLIKNVVNPEKRINYFYSETGMQDGFNHLLCVEVNNISNMPDGLLLRSLIQSEFAVFVADLGKGGDYARQTWLPQSGYTENYEVFGDLEIYEQGKNLCEFWLPVSLKK
jgi:predicted transcriptional regulator YdeE